MRTCVAFPILPRFLIHYTFAIDTSVEALRRVVRLRAVVVEAPLQLAGVVVDVADQL